MTKKFNGTIGKTVEQSVSQWTEGKKPNGPNVAFIVLDDLGFSQLGCFGSSISTSNIDSLSQRGLVYNNFHTTAMCSPTRASLLTGRNPHTTGVSFVTDFNNGFPNNQGKVSKETAMLSEILLDEGYNTFAVGKWHLNPGEEQSSSGPFDGWPLGRGFERYYGFLGGSTNQFYPDLIEDNHRIQQPKSPEEGYHLSEDLTDKAIEYIREQKSVSSEKPFFMYLSYAAPHAPHHAPQEYIEKYRGKFDKGWDEIREEWYKRQIDLGIIPKTAQLPPRNPDVKGWETLGDEEKKLYTRFQEVFAGYLEHTDVQIGRFIQCLKDINQLENTIIVFLSDNGACALGGEQGSVNSWAKDMSVLEETFEDKLERYDEIGGPSANNHYPAGWAQAGNTPLKWYKTFTHAGGVRCPLIIHYPRETKNEGQIRSQYHHVTDIVPTILEILDIEEPRNYRGVPQKPIHGTSLAYTFTQPDIPSKKEVQHYEIMGNRGIWFKGWKAVAHHKPDTLFEEDEWELYDADKDFTEVNNLADDHPEKLKELINLWWAEAEKYDVFPLDGRSLRKKIASSAKNKSATTGPIHKEYYTKNSIFHHTNAPDLRDKSFNLQVELFRQSENSKGVLVAHGDNSGGYSMFIKNNKLCFLYNVANSHQYEIQSSKELPNGSIVINFLFLKQEDNKGIGKIFVNGEQIGEGILGNIDMLGFSNGSFQIGQNVRAPISAYDTTPSIFTGEIMKVTYTLGGHEHDLESLVKLELLTE